MIELAMGSLYQGNESMHPVLTEGF